MRRKSSARDADVAAVVVERALPQPFLRQEFEIDIGDDDIAPISAKRGNSARITPFSAIVVCPSQARSVVDSPFPAAE